MIAADRAYAEIRRQIVDGSLPAGSFLVETELAKAIGVSRTPVRDALRRLEGEGLVATSDHKRAVVRDFDEADIEECFELRALLESHAAARAARRLTPEALRELEALATEMEAVVKKGGVEAPVLFSDLNDRFHDKILAHAGSERLRDLLRPLMQVQLALMKRYRHTIAAHLERSCWHHRELIAAFRAGDPIWAETQMRTHLLSAKNPAG
jgi:DNA-binding GntR family transcriptional regulator